MGIARTYCGRDVEAQDPVVATEGRDASEGRTSQFCNYGCLVAHVDAETLTDGDACEWSATS
ncbi:hypothetical protein [Halosolutus halophilus]|uniref:hypothetical protein n=1 Tax=Halosolutus halophilus TaxID=1552990 RepID=UPI002234F5B9|nr:hypothetical protein [Halosolutus halophilus]